MMGKTPQGRDDLRQARSQGALREGFGRSYGEEEVMDPHLSALTWPESSFCLQEVS